MPANSALDTRRLALIKSDTGTHVSGAIVEAAPDGVSVVFSGGPSASLALGERIELEVDWTPGEPQLELSAFVRDLSNLDSHVRCELEFDFEGPMGRDLTAEALRLIFNRRRSERVTLERAEQPVVRMTDERTGRAVEGWLSDLSTGGLGLRLSMSAVPDLADTERVRLEFTLPEASSAIELSASLRNCRPQGACVVLGFEFEHAPSGEARIETPRIELTRIERDEIRNFVSRRLAAAVLRIPRTEPT